MKKIFVLTGEPSGDKLASTAISKIQKDNNDIEYLSVGGVNPSPANSDVIDYVNISTRSDAIDFGNLLTAKIKPGVGTDGSRGVSIGGTGATTEIDYWAFGSTGNAAEFW